MAVIIKKKALTITSLLTRLFSAEDLAGTGHLHHAQDLESSGHTLLVSPTTFSIAAPGNAHVLSKVPLKNETVSLAIKKNVGHTVMVAIKEKVVHLIETAYDTAKTASASNIIDKAIKPPFKSAADSYVEVMEVFNANGGNKKVAAIKRLRQLTNCSLKDAKDVVEAWIDTDGIAMPSPKIVGKGVPVVDTEEVQMKTQSVYGVCTNLKQAPVLLVNATEINQPVCGTSGGSIYHVIAIGQSCVVAARIRGNNEIAIRAEIKAAAASAEGQKAKSGLKFAGLELKNGGHYSLHLEPEDFAMVKRSIGSTLFAMSIPFWGTSTDLNLIQGAGK